MSPNESNCHNFCQTDPNSPNGTKSDPNNQLNQNEGSSPHVRLESQFDLEDTSIVTTSLVMFAYTFR
jgi:hypothetical protein